MQAELEAAQEPQRKTRRFTLYIGVEEDAALDKRSAESGAPKAELIRRALRAQYLSNRPEPWS